MGALSPTQGAAGDVPQEVLHARVTRAHPKATVTWASSYRSHARTARWRPVLITVAGWLLPAPPGRLTDRAQEVLGAWPAGQGGAEHGSLAAPAVYVAFADVACLTAETQTTQDPGLSLLSDNK